MPRPKSLADEATALGEPIGGNAIASSAYSNWYPRVSAYAWDARHKAWLDAMEHLTGERLKEFTFVRIHTTFAPKWLHALWDVCSEAIIDRDCRQSLTSKAADLAVTKKLARDATFRAAWETAYDLGGLPALAEIAAKVLAGEM